MLRGFVVETKQEEGDSEYHAVVNKRVKSNDSDTQWVVFRNGEHEIAPENIEWENTDSQVQYPCLLFYEYSPIETEP